MTSPSSPEPALKWDAAKYLQFAEERTRPCRELAARVAIASPRKVIDLGCGPGNSTQVLAERWPGAELTGLDSSSEMIDAARRALPECRWLASDIADWAATEREPFDVIFSNAALQWVSDHATIFPTLLERVAPGGALAVQMPNNLDAPAHRVARSLVASPSWRDRFPSSGVREWHVHAPEFYYDLIAPHVDRIDLWETEYVQVMQDAEAILDWYKGTGLRQYFAALSNAIDRERFAAGYLEAIRVAYPPRPDGRVLFPFRRLFLAAYAAGQPTES
jgi:trans-aconitate 2-methyltransferase